MSDFMTAGNTAYKISLVQMTSPFSGVGTLLHDTFGTTMVLTCFSGRFRTFLGSHGHKFSLPSYPFYPNWLRYYRTYARSHRHQKRYEDNLEGKISDERFAKMTANYEAEQHTLEQRVTELRASISAEKETALNADHFLTLVRKYTEIPELTAEIIREFVEKVYVYKAEKVDGHRVQRIKIIYNCIGEFTLPDAAKDEKTA